MKNILKMISILLLVIFSFFYTDKVINFINKKDPLMNEIDLRKDKYEVLPINAVLENNTIIPGIKGKSVDLDKSYENMKLSGIFREDYLVYNDILPSELLSNNMDKYIVGGNPSSNKISLIVIANYDNLNKIKNQNITIFLNHSDINIKNIKMINNSVYTYGNNGTYNEEMLNNDNTIINRISKNSSIYCLSREKNNDTLSICNEKKMYVVIPSIIGDYLDIKNNLTNGSIILLNDINNLDVIVKYINSKGYIIVPLEELLTE